MDKLVGMAFQLIAALGFAVFLLGCAAKDAFAILPHVLCVLKPNIALYILKAGNGILAVGLFGAVEAAPGQQTGQLGDGDTVELFVEDVIHALLQIRYLLFQPMVR